MRISLSVFLLEVGGREYTGIYLLSSFGRCGIPKTMQQVGNGVRVESLCLLNIDNIQG